MSDAPPPPSPRSPSAQDARRQTKISDFFPVVDNARASNRPRTECQLATKSSPAKRLKGVVEEEEEMEEEGAVSDPDITLMETENQGNGELVTTAETPAALRVDRLSVVEKPSASVAMFDVNPQMVKMNPSNPNKGNGELVMTKETPAALRVDRLSVVEKPSASVAMFDVNSKMVKMYPSNPNKGNNELVTTKETPAALRVDRLSVVEKPSASVAMFDVNPKMVKMNPSKARTNDAAIFNVNPKMVKMNPSKASATEEQKRCSTSKYRLRPIDKDMDVDTTITKEGDSASNAVATKTGESASNTLSAAIDVDMVSLVETPNALTINVSAPSKASVSNERCVGKYMLRPIGRDTGVNATVTKTEDTLPNAYATGNGESVTKVNTSPSKTSINREQKARQHTLKPIEQDSSVDAVDTVTHASATDAGESVTNKLSDAADVDTQSLVNKPNAVATNSDVPDKETKSGPSKWSRRRARKHALRLIEKDKKVAAATAPRTKGNQAAQTKGNQAAQTKGNQAAQTKGNQAAQTKGNHHSAKKLRWLDREDDSPQTKGNQAAKTKGNQAAKTKGNQAAQTKGNHYSTKKLRWPDSEDDSSRDSDDGVKGNIVSPLAPLQYLPFEVMESILLKVVAMEVTDMKLARSVWKEKADLVMSRLRTVCLQWSNILATNFFRIQLDRILEQIDTIHLTIIDSFSLRSAVQHVAALNDDIYLVEEMRGGSDISVYTRANMAEVTDVIPLHGISLRAIDACNTSSCVYVLCCKKGRQFSITRIRRDDNNKFTVSLFIMDIWLADPIWSLSNNGDLILATPKVVGLAKIMIFSATGSMKHTLQLSSSVSWFSKIIPKSDGSKNLILVNSQSQAKTRLVEIDLHGVVVRQYVSSLNALTRVCLADVYGRMILLERLDRFEILDAELNRIEVVGLQVDCVISDKLQYNSERNEIVAVLIGQLLQNSILAILQLTEAR